MDEVTKKNVLYCVYPRKTKAVSVTGGWCELKCAHCGGHYLKNMQPFAGISDISRDKSLSWLVSGGCTKNGIVPLYPHYEKLKEYKQGKKYNFHVGFLPERDIHVLAELADCVSLDFVGDDKTIHEVYGLRHSTQDYINIYQELRLRLKVIPHICIGLAGGKIRGEYEALNMLKNIGAESLVFIVFIPTRGTLYENCSPPLLEEVVHILTYARNLFPHIPLHLGCMRPGGSYRRKLDTWAVRIGMDVIVQPTPDALELARDMKLSLVEKEECCVL